MAPAGTVTTFHTLRALLTAPVSMEVFSFRLWSLILLLLFISSTQKPVLQKSRMSLSSWCTRNSTFSISASTSTTLTSVFSFLKMSPSRPSPSIVVCRISSFPLLHVHRSSIKCSSISLSTALKRTMLLESTCLKQLHLLNTLKVVISRFSCDI